MHVGIWWKMVWSGATASPIMSTCWCDSSLKYGLANVHVSQGLVCSDRIIFD